MDTTLELLLGVREVLFPLLSVSHTLRVTYQRIINKVFIPIFRGLTVPDLSYWTWSWSGKKESGPVSMSYPRT